jgi:flagellar hook-associated protein 3 FlgL
MRISTQQFYRQGVDVMLEQQTKLNKVETQLASGKQVNTPSDDPSAAVQILNLTEVSDRLAQYQRNAGIAQSRLEQEEVALQGINNLLQRVRELAVQGNNGSQGVENRQAIAYEIRQHLEGFLQLANSTDANGEYVFAGYRTDTAPYSHDGVGNFTYNGDSGQRRLQIGDGRDVAIGDPGSAIFDAIPADAGGTTDLGSIIHDLAASFEAGNADPNALADLDPAIGRVLDTRAKVGARVAAIEDQRSSNDALDLAVVQVKSSLEDLDYAEAISRFNQQLVGLQASQQAFMKIQNLSLFNFIG